MIRSSGSIAAAGGAICLALIDVLVSKGILTADDVRQISTAAQRDLTAVAGASGVDDAVNGARIVSTVFAKHSK
jgi:hypothetical protein